jgi:hypothetical protein
MADPSAPSGPNVVTQNSTDPTDSRFPLLIADEGSFKDVDLSVKFTNSLEDNYRLYHVVAGKRHQFAGANFEMSSGEWHELRVECVSARIICYYDGVKKIDATDDTFRDAGKVGLWTKADSVTYFDDLPVIAK